MTGGLSTNDTLFAQSVGALQTTSTTMQSIENVVFAANTGTAGGVLDLTNTSGIKNLTLSSSVDVTNTVTGINSGIQTVTLNTSAAAAATTYTLTFANAATSGAADSIILNTSGLGTPGAGAVAAVRDIVIAQPTSGTNGFETVNLVSSGGVTNVMQVQTTNATTLNISGTATDTILTDTNITTINASTATGGQVITVAANSGVQTITGGAGNDRIVLNATYSTADVIDGGAGRDTVVMAIADLSTTATRTNLANIEVVGNSDALGGTTVTLANWGTGVNGFRLGAVSTGVIAYGASTAATLDLTNTNGANNVTVSADITSVTDTISISSGTATTNGGAAQGTIVANNFEIVNVSALTSVGNYTAITLAPSAGSLGTVNFTGSLAITGGTVTAGIVTGAAMTGAATLTATMGTAGSLTGTANNDVLVGSAGADSISGGAGNDTITGGVGIDIVNVGTGTDTVVIPGTLAANIATNRDTIIGFNTGTGGDLVNISQAAAGATTYVEFGAVAATYAITSAATAANSVRVVNEFSFNTATPTVSANSLDATLGGANALDGTNLLLALGNGGAATLTTTASQDAYIVAYQNGNAYLYQASNGAGNTAVVAAEIALIGTFNGVAAGSFDVANFL